MNPSSKSRLDIKKIKEESKQIMQNQGANSILENTESKAKRLHFNVPTQQSNSPQTKSLQPFKKGTNLHRKKISMN